MFVVKRMSSLFCIECGPVYFAARFVHLVFLVATRFQVSHQDRSSSGFRLLIRPGSMIESVEYCFEITSFFGIFRS